MLLGDVEAGVSEHGLKASLTSHVGLSYRMKNFSPKTAGRDQGERGGWEREGVLKWLLAPVPRILIFREFWLRSFCRGSMKDLCWGNGGMLQEDTGENYPIFVLEKQFLPTIGPTLQAKTLGPWFKCHSSLKILFSIDCRSIRRAKINPTANFYFFSPLLLTQLLGFRVHAFLLAWDIPTSVCQQLLHIFSTKDFEDLWDSWILERIFFTWWFFFCRLQSATKVLTLSGSSKPCTVKISPNRSWVSVDEYSKVVFSHLLLSIFLFFMHTFELSFSLLYSPWFHCSFWNSHVLKCRFTLSSFWKNQWQQPLCGPECQWKCESSTGHRNWMMSQKHKK